MSTKNIIIMSGLMLSLMMSISHAENGGFTQEDREMLIKLEERITASNARIDAVNTRIDDVNTRIDDQNKRMDERFEALTAQMDTRFEAMSTKMDTRFEAMSTRMDDFKNVLYVILAGMFALVGFVLWDRRTALLPAINKNRELEEKEDRIERALKQLAEKDPKIAEVLKSVGIL